MTWASVLLGIVLSTLYGALFHFLRGGSLGRLFLYIVLAWIGFWGGHVFADLANLSLIRVGPLNAGIATIGSFFFMLAGYWLSLVEVERG